MRMPENDEDKRTSEELASAKLREEINKLKSEISDATWNRKFGRYASLISPFVTAALTLLGIYYGAWQFNKSLSNDRDKIQQQQIHDREVQLRQLNYDRELKRQEREHDFLKTFALSQSTTYFTLCQAAGTIAAYSPNDPRSNSSLLKFIQLYRGDAHIVADDAVVNAMDQFQGCMNGNNATCRNPTDQINRLRDLSLKLADACRSSMARTAKTDVSQISNFEDLFRAYKDDQVKGE
jgi:hypothetical protein